MAKMTAPGVSMKKKMGGMDGARKSSKKQLGALMPAAKAPKSGASPPAKRMAKMEKMDVPV